jgi:hypothetical protein
MASHKSRPVQHVYMYVLDVRMSGAEPLWRPTVATVCVVGIYVHGC